jgi:UDP-N-acetylglucosamine 2-epimerase (non-hydrolysing)
MAPVVKALAEQPGIDSRVCVTAQHREMLDQVLYLFQIHPDYDLNLMRPNQTLAGLTAEILENVDPILTKVKPDWILVQGDTTTVMASALAAFYRNIKVGHVEAGLRTGDKHQPFPEEINRRIAGTLADLHFAPTEHSRQNLLREGVEDWRIAVTGNTDIDALQQICKLDEPEQVSRWLTDWGVAAGKARLVLVEAHRRENFGTPIEEICSGLKALANRYGDALQIAYPVHLNPNIQEPVHRLLGGVANIHLLVPQDYLHMVHLLKAATLVLTDSGGIQEEATVLGKPTLVLRKKTERPEGVEAGVLKLVGTDAKNIFNESVRLLDNPAAYAVMSHAANPFGDGHAAERIVKALMAFQESDLHI